jgi:thioester reductase-like protein
VAPGSLLLTGSTGFLGSELLRRYAERDDRTVYALIRASSDDEATERLGDLAGERVVAVAGDITSDDLGLSGDRWAQLADEVTDVVHSAASVSFALPLDASRHINVLGTRNVLDFARACTRLNCLSYVSTAYVAGKHNGGFRPGDLDVGQEFNNAYELSKFEAEGMVRDEAADGLPARIFRPSIIVGDSRTGYTPSFNVLYWPIRAYQRGLYSMIPARRRSPVDVVPVDHVADAIVELGGQRPARPGTTHHLTASERASSVGELLELGSSYFGMDPPRPIPPALYRRIVHPALLLTSSKRRQRMLEASEVFFPYFAMRVRFSDPAIKPPPLRAYFNRLLDFAVGCDWGKKPMQREQRALVTA